MDARLSSNALCLGFFSEKGDGMRLHPSRGFLSAVLVLISCQTAFGQLQGAADVRPDSVTLVCDETLKKRFKPDSLTSVVLVKQFRKGEQVALAKDAPTTAPTASRDICLVKLNVGPGNAGPAGAPSTSRGIGIEIWLPSPANWNERIHAFGGRWISGRTGGLTGSNCGFACLQGGRHRGRSDVDDRYRPCQRCHPRRSPGPWRFRAEPRRFDQ